jgi:nucleoid-associated protein YgaU
MNKRINIVVLASLAVLVGLVWWVARNGRNTPDSTGVATATPANVETPAMSARIEPAPLPIIPVSAAPPIVREPVVQLVEPISEDPTRHVAQPGETVNSLAGDLLGKDTATNRNAIINANPSLQADPDKLLAGKSYHIPSAEQASLAAAAPVEAVAAPTIPSPATVAQLPTPTAKVLKYTATSGDTVSTLAGAFLGNGDQAHQDKIISANPSLQANPDRVLAGKVYRIPAPDGLSASVQSLEPKAVTIPATQPDADQVVADGSARSLRYTARAGDTVTTLAIELLGSDTPETRQAIINDNPVLKQNPDRIVAGQTYWIPAPTAVAQNP